MLQTYEISITGQVQGVGFRPYVYTLAKQFFLLGTVSNNQDGVVIYIKGLHENCMSFYEKLIEKPPPVARVLGHSIKEVAERTFDNFQIITSTKNGAVNLSLTPDFAICETCRNELTDASNRRHGYPFTTCVHCGPRWAITQRFPFERSNTSIQVFEMCEKCDNEYISPDDIRFHSQTNSCPTCGIEVTLLDAKGIDTKTSKEHLFGKTAELLKNGNIIAVKNTSGFLLCCNAEDPKAVKMLRERKNRPKKPFAVLYPDIQQLKEALAVSEEIESVLSSSVRPICIVNGEKIKGGIALEQVAPGLKQLGVMLPYSGILEMLARELNFPIVATSGNIHGSPVLSKTSEGLQKIGDVADYFLVHNLRIEHPQDDSVLKHSYKFKKEVLFRRARGYAPNFFCSDISSNEKIMAMGAHLKSSVAFYPNDYLYISQYLGHLDNFDVYQRFIKVSEAFIDLFEQQPTVILADAHPAYESTKFGKQLAAKLNIDFIKIQHHKAHFAAILGNHQLFDKKVLGVVFDGTGMGDDGAIWGGEFFNYQAGRIERTSHIDYYDWLLGDKMAKEPRLSLFSVANAKLKELLAQKFKPHELNSYKVIKAENKLKTSSAGRMFDAVASLLGLTDYNSYEGEAAMLLENQVESYDLNTCRSYLSQPEIELNVTEIIENIYFDRKNGVPVSDCIQNFIFTLANAIIVRAKTTGFNHIACSGGVFQNTLLVDMLLDLAPKTINLYFHKDISPNDENISFGQIMYYLNCTQ